MTLTGTDRGVGSRNTGGESTYVITPGGTIPVGSLALLCVVYDNSGTNGADPFSSISDSVGNTWNNGTAALRDPGAANAGIVTRYCYSVLTTQLTTSDTITVSFGGITTVARAYALHQITSDIATPQLAGDSGANGASTTPSRLRLAVPSGHMVIGVMGAAGNAAITADSDTTNGSWSTQQTSGVGVGAAGAEIASQRKVVTAAGDQTYNVTITSADWAVLVVEFSQTAATITPTGSVTPAATLAKARTQSYAGSSTPAGSMSKQIAKALAGSTTPIGAVTDSVGKILSGATTPHGSITASVGKRLAGSVTPTGTLTPQIAKALAGTVTPTGALSRLVSKILAGTTTPTGALAKQTTKASIGTIGPTGTLADQVAKVLAAALPSSGDVDLNLAKVLGGTLAPAGTHRVLVSKRLAGTITPSGQLAKLVGIATNGLLGLSGTLQNAIAAAAQRGGIEVSNRLADRVDVDAKAAAVGVSERPAAATVTVTERHDSVDVTGSN